MYKQCFWKISHGGDSSTYIRWCSFANIKPFILYNECTVDLQNEKSIMSDEGTTSHITIFR